MIERNVTPDSAVVVVPRHVAIVMDGNERWARDRGLSANDGHRAGVDALRATIRAAARAGVEILTVYASSGERLVRDFAAAETEMLRAENVRVGALGRIGALPASARHAIDALARASAANDGMLLNLALNYGARAELVDAIRALAVDVQRGRLGLDAIDDDVLGDYLYTAGLPDPDLLIRTGGELRVSNFLLYQIAYTELWSTPQPWPAFGGELLGEALAEYATRQRRFGS